MKVAPFLVLLFALFVATSAQAPINCADIQGSLEVLANPLTGSVILQEDGFYDFFRTQYASITYPTRVRPSFIVKASNEADVQAAVLFAAECGYSVSARSGGHSYLALSSCDSTEKPCMQIDVENIDHATVIGDKINIGPGFHLYELADFLRANGMFLPTGECAGVGLGGHMQTGGFGMWSRQFGAFATRVESFRIVLANGSAHHIVTPSTSTDKFNDDLFYAVLGGASGSWGIITDITVNPVRDADYHSVYYQVNFVWNLEGAVNMFRTWSELARANQHDSRWSTHWTVIGLAPAQRPNILRLEASWVGPISEASDHDPTFFQTIIDACTGCFKFESYIATEPLSKSLQEHYVKVREGSRREFDLPYERAWQQTSSFPDSDEIERIIRKLNTVLPKPTSPHFVIAQLSTGASGVSTRPISLPWPEDVFGSTIDFFFFGPQLTSIYNTLSNDFAQTCITNFDGEDHRMFWGAYDDPVFPRDQALYYDSRQKFMTLTKIKAVVDPNNLFNNRMSMPVHPKSNSSHSEKAN